MGVKKKKKNLIIRYAIVIENKCKVYYLQKLIGIEFKNTATRILMNTLHIKASSDGQVHEFIPPKTSCGY